MIRYMWRKENLHMTYLKFKEKVPPLFRAKVYFKKLQEAIDGWSVVFNDACQVQAVDKAENIN
jgi:hypothetical protein